MALLKASLALLKRPWIPARYGKAPYFWLLSFMIFGWKYLYLVPASLEMIMMALSFLLFLPIYFYSFWVQGWRVGVSVFVACCLGIAWANFNYGGSCFIIFGTTMCSRFQDKRTAYFAFGLVFAFVALASYVFRLETFFWVPALIFSVPSTIGAIIGETLMRTNETLSRKQEEIQHLAALAERERIGRDLHDLLGHTLSVITLKAELARKLLERDNEACRKEIHDIEHTARHALSEVRSAVLGYRDTGLAHELRNAQSTLASAQVSFSSDVQTDALPAAVENIIALALREAVTNILRHSQATACKVTLAQRDNQLLFQISDNGFSHAPEHEQVICKGSGLRGMGERVLALGGTLDIKTTGGVSIAIALPLAN